jgi:hypothetical protein
LPFFSFGDSELLDPREWNNECESSRGRDLGTLVKAGSVLADARLDADDRGFRKECDESLAALAMADLDNLLRSLFSSAADSLRDINFPRKVLRDFFAVIVGILASEDVDAIDPA